MSQTAAFGASRRAGARTGVLRRALRREAARLRQPRHMAAIVLLALVIGIGGAMLYARGELAGADARAYWTAVRIWIDGGDPYHATGPFLPYIYFPWLLPLFVPWALLPWEIAWFAWRAANLFLLAWSIGWAYRLRPLATAVTVVALSPAFLASLDTGNVNPLLVLMIWAARLTGPRLGGLLWALPTAMKWLPFVFLPLLAPRARAWGVAFLAVGGVLTLLTLEATLIQVQVLLGDPRPPRLDYLVFLWVFVPVLWPDPDPARWLRPATWLAPTRAWLADLRTPAGTVGRLRRFFGLAPAYGAAAGTSARSVMALARTRGVRAQACGPARAPGAATARRSRTGTRRSAPSP